MPWHEAHRTVAQLSERAHDFMMICVVNFYIYLVHTPSLLLVLLLRLHDVGLSFLHEYLYILRGVRVFPFLICCVCVAL